MLNITTPPTTETVQVKAEVTGDVEVDSVILYYVASSLSPFESVPMFDDGADDGAVVHEVTTERVFEKSLGLYLVLDSS